MSKGGGKFMKKFIGIFAIALFTTLGAQAAENPLKPLMQRLGDRFQTLGRQIRDPQQNPSSLELAREINGIVREAYELSPTVVAEMPAAQQPAAQVRYQRFLTQLLLADLDVQDALLVNNNQTALAALQRMSALRNEAHSIFHPHPHPHP